MTDVLQWLGLVVQLFLALCAGWWFKERCFNRTPSLKEEQFRQLWSKMQEFSADVALNVGEHSKRVEQLSQELDTLQSADDQPERQNAERDIVAQILAANKQLHEQLAASERRIKQQVQTIETMSSETRIDSLTNLANRRALDEELSRRYAAWQYRPTPLSLILVGLDHLPEIQAESGPDAGHELLREVGKLLAAKVREIDVIARYGQTEFIIVLPETNVTGANVLAERCRTAIEGAQMKFDERALDVTVSIGVAEIQTGDEMASFLGHADMALTAAKENGRNRAYYYDGRGCLPILAEEAGDLPRDGKCAAPQAPLTTKELRSHARKMFLRTEYIAPYVSGRFPAPDDFSEIQCFDISVGGISFFLPSPPEHQKFILALGQAPQVIYTKVQVARVEMTKLHTLPMYVVGCQFTGRIQPPTKTDSPVACSAC